MNNNTLVGQPQDVALRVVITIDKNNNLSVSGFPSNFGQAMAVMQSATHAVAKEFVDRAMIGKLDEKLNLIQDKILVPKPAPIILPVGNKN